MLGFFRKPSVDAKKPSARNKAIQQLPGNDPARIQAALHDDDLQVRLTAIQALTDIDTLITISNNTAYSTPALHEAALAQLEVISPATKHADQLAKLQLNEAQALTLVQSSSSPAIRLQALSKVTDPSILAQLALDDEASAVRQYAFEKTDLEAHPQLAKQIIDRYKGKDKRLSKLAEVHYQRQQTDAANQQQLTDTLAGMQQLADEEATDLSAFAQLEQQWRSLYEQANDEQRQRWETLHDKAQRRLKAQSDQRAARQAILDKAQTLRADLQSKPYLSPVESDALVDDIAALQAEWQAVGSGDDPDSLRIERECNQVFEQLQKAYQQLSQNYQHSNRQRQMIEELDNVLQQPGRVDGKTIQQIQSRWKQMPKVNDAQLQIELDQFFSRKFQKLEARQTTGESVAAEELAQLKLLQAKLDDAVEAQKLKEALAARREIGDLLSHCLGLTDKQREQANRHLSQHRGTIQQLQDWAKWGGSQAREQLIADLTAASTQEQTPKAIVAILRTARKQWHQINQESGYPDKAIKQAFEAACDQLHEPVKAANQANNEAQTQALAERESLVAALEATGQETDWNRYKDWPALNEQLRKAQQSWSKAGGVNKQDWKTINDRYRAAKQALQSRLSSPLEREIARRERLIQQAESLSESDDKSAAMQTIKQLRADWKPQLTTARKQENALWERFNTACNAIFEQSKTEQKAQRAEDDAALASRRSLLDELKTHQAHKHWSTILDARRSVDSLQQSWLHQQEIDSPAAGKLEKQWRQQCDQFQHSAVAAQRVKQLVMLDGLFQTAIALQQSETALSKQDSAIAAQNRETATSLAAQYPDYQSSLIERIAEINSEEWASGNALDDLAEQCLELEIMAQIPSPESEQEARRAKQVSLLAEQMTQVITEEQRLDNLIAHVQAFVAITADNAEMLYERYATALQASIEHLMPDGWTLTPPLAPEDSTAPDANEQKQADDDDVHSLDQPTAEAADQAVEAHHEGSAESLTGESDDADNGDNGDAVEDDHLDNTENHEDTTHA